MALFLLKNYGRSRASASAFGVYTSTWQYYTERFVHAISALSTTKICWMDRFIDAPTDYEYLATVDGTDFHRQEDYTKHDPGLYSHKLNNPGYRYEVAVGVFSGEIVSLNGPFNAGSNSDVKIFRSDLKQKLGENEKALADRGYRGDEDIVTNYDKDIVFEEKRRRSRELALHENVNESKREVQRKMVLDLPFQVDERFFVHNSANGINAPGVNFVKFTNTLQCLLIVDLVKKKAPIYAGRTNEIDMDIPAFTRASSRY